MKDNYISVAKALGIILVVMGHSGCPVMLSKFIGFFHMPLFFILSGFFYREENTRHPVQYLNKKIIGLYWPYQKWVLPFLWLYNLLFLLGLYSTDMGFLNNVGSHALSFKEICIRTITNLLFFTGSTPLTSGVWFISCLFYGCIFLMMTGCLVNKCKRGGVFRANIFISAIILYAAYLIMDYFQFAIPPYGFIHSKTFLSAVFIALGFLLRQPIEKVLLRDMQRVFCSMIATGAILLCAVKWLPAMTMDVDYEHSIVYILISFVGVVFTLSASKWMFSFVPLKNFLVYIGKNTLIIFFLHLSAFKIISFFLIEYCDLPFNWLAKINIPMGHAWILYSLAGVLLPVGIYYLWEKHVAPRFDLDKIVTPYISRFVFAAASRIQMIFKHSDDDCKKN